MKTIEIIDKDHIRIKQGHNDVVQLLKDIERLGW